MNKLKISHLIKGNCDSNTHGNKFLIVFPYIWNGCTVFWCYFDMYWNKFCAKLWCLAVRYSTLYRHIVSVCMRRWFFIIIYDIKCILVLWENSTFIAAYSIKLQLVHECVCMPSISSLASSLPPPMWPWDENCYKANAFVLYTTFVHYNAFIFIYLFFFWHVH